MSNLLGSWRVNEVTDHLKHKHGMIKGIDEEAVKCSN